MHPFVQSLRHTAGGVLRRSSAVSRPVELLGAHTAADRIDRVVGRGEIVAVRLPPGPREWRTRRIKAWRRNGTDQWVEAFRLGGWWGYERPLPDVFVALLRDQRGTVMDVGANTGVYALLAARLRGVHVYAFEAYAPVTALLHQNISLNRAGHRIEVVPVAVTDVEGEVEFWVPPPTGAVETSCSTEAGFKEDAVPVTVPATTLDAFWESVGRPATSVVKLDVEGAEHRVLLGAGEFLARTRPTVFLEILPGADLGALERVRAEHGFTDVRLSPREAVVGDDIRFDGEAWNHAFVPHEKLEPFVQVAAGAGLEVTRL